MFASLDSPVNQAVARWAVDGTIISHGAARRLAAIVDVCGGLGWFRESGELDDGSAGGMAVEFTEHATAQRGALGWHGYVDKVNALAAYVADRRGRGDLGPVPGWSMLPIVVASA